MSRKIYQIPHTDKGEKPINVPRRVFINDLVDLTLIGKRTLEYGAQLNENLLHLLEHFSCPAHPDNLELPDENNKLSEVLNNPVEGQLWYNSSSRKIHVWDSSRWTELHELNSVNGNSGFIYDGEYIPIPENQFGALHKIDDCAVSVSPMYMGYPINAFECYSNPFGKVVAKYTDTNGVVHSGYAHYAIICDGECRLPPPPVYLISVPDNMEVERYTPVTLTAVISGNPSEHSFKWVQTNGPAIELEPVDDYTVTFVADADTAGDIELTFYIDKNTSIEQKLTTVVTQLGEIQLLTSQQYGINKITDAAASNTYNEGGMLRIVPAPLEFGTDGTDIVQSNVSLRGGMLSNMYLKYDNAVETLTPSLDLVGGSMHKALLTAEPVGDSTSPSVAPVGGSLDVVLVTTSYSESTTPSVGIISGTLI